MLGLGHKARFLAFLGIEAYGLGLGLVTVALASWHRASRPFGCEK